MRATTNRTCFLARQLAHTLHADRRFGGALHDQTSLAEQSPADCDRIDYATPL